jgi:invasion protein IalB
MGDDVPNGVWIQIDELAWVRLAVSRTFFALCAIPFHIKL